MKIAVTSDHAGRDLSKALVEELRRDGHEVADIGPRDGQAVDYPDFGAEAARRVASGEFEKGILVCGTGLGMAIAANKVPGVRAVACTSEYMAEMARRHNDANVLCLGARVVGEGLAVSIMRTFLRAGFEGGRHGRRVSKIEELDRRDRPGG